MEAREVKVIDTSGRNGHPGPEFWVKKPAEAPYGQWGENGGSAGAPTAGQPGSDIRIRVAYSNDEAGIVQVTGEGPHTGQMWKIARDEKLRLNAKGGDGGAGGRGEDGQAGGRGRDGRDATRHRDGEDGQNGARGGDGGYGSNGADGAAAGNVFLTVHDDDTDLLVPLEFNVQGGAGGASGEHGEPGDGGVGGRGGTAHAWTETHGNRVYACSRPGGSNGTNGSPGTRPSVYLTGGKAGPQGSIQIKVIRGDLSEATYPSPYALQVVKFDVIDENEDGVNEPGEHLLVHNIRVRNAGGMPSPEQRSIHLLIQGTQFLAPISSEPIELPRSIQPGQEVEVPGILRAYIRNEWAEKPVGSALNHFDNIQLLAIFHERLNRPIPHFCGFTQVLISYPIRLDAPTYLDCVAKGDKVRFKWVVHNNSKKSYGADGILKRATATRLSDPARFFTLTHAAQDKPDEATDDLPEIEPNNMITVDQDFSVDERTLEFSEGFLTLELMLSDPITGKMRSVQKHRMHMQISGLYSLSPNPSYLLVVNSKTPNHAIHQIISLLRHRLHTHLDIFNLSLTGTYNSPVTNQNVLNSYAGKSVIVFGNSFPYFDQGNKDPWSLLDPWQTGMLVKGGTNVLFAAVSNMEGLKQWSDSSIFPAYDFASAALSFNNESFDQLVTTLRDSETQPTTSDMAVHRVAVKKGIFGSVQSTVESATHPTAKKLNKNFPLRRFITVPDMGAVNEAGKTGGLIVSEGVPKNANMMASQGFFPPSPPGTNIISDYDMYFIICCLPFAVRAKIFWNAIGRSDAAGANCDIVYSGLENLRYTMANEAPAQAKVDDRILQAISISLQHTITAEIYTYTSTRPRFPSPLSTPHALTHLQNFTTFLSLAPHTPQITSLASAQPLVSTLASIHCLTNPIGTWQTLKTHFSFLGNRKGQLTPAANTLIFSVLNNICAGDIQGTVREHMLQRSKQVCKGIKSAGGKKSFSGYGMGELRTWMGVQAVAVCDLTGLKGGSVAMNGVGLNGVQAAYHVHRQNMVLMEEGAKRKLIEMVNVVDPE